MAFVLKYYFLFMETVLKCYCLKPFQSELGKLIILFVYNVCTTSLLIALIAGLVEYPRKVPHVIYENGMAILFLAVATVKFFILHMSREKMQRVYEEFSLDLQRILDFKEKIILTSYINKGQHRVYLSLSFFLPAFILAGGLTFYPALSGPLNKTRDENFPYYYSKMIISDQLYYQLVDLHITVGIVFTGFCYFATGAAFMMYTSQVCGVFAIARYRLQNITNIPFENTRVKNFKLQESVRNGKITCNLVNVVQLHIEAIQKVQIIDDTFTLNLLIVQVTGLGAFGILIYDIFRHDSTIFHAIRSTLLLLTFMGFNYLINWAAQEIIEICQKFSMTSYFIDWYTMPIEAKKMLVILRTKAINYQHLRAGPVFTLSLNNLLWIFKASWSVAAVLLSTQSKVKYATF